MHLLCCSPRKSVFHVDLKLLCLFHPMWYKASMGGATGNMQSNQLIDAYS